MREQVVEFGYELFHGRYELYEAFGNEYGAEVEAGVGSVNNDADDLVNDLVECHLLGSDFLAYEADVGLRLQSALERDVACGASHEADEVPVFLGGVGVALYVANQFAIDLAGGVEAE